MNKILEYEEMIRKQSKTIRKLFKMQNEFVYKNKVLERALLNVCKAYKQLYDNSYLETTTKVSSVGGFYNAFYEIAEEEIKKEIFYNDK